MPTAPGMTRIDRGAIAGVLLSLGAAATFGVLTPAAKGALAHVDPVRGAALAYLAAGTVALATHLLRSAAAFGSLGRTPQGRDIPRLLGLTVFGGMVGPALYFAGVARIAAHRAAVVQHLEYVLTIVAAVLVLGERPGRKGFIGLALVGAGVLALSIVGERGGFGGEPLSASGLALIVAACAAWAVDNTLARGASDLDPLVVVSIKGLGAGGVLALASAGSAWPSDGRAWALLLLSGGVGVGVSLLLELLALRKIGAATNAGLFATGPAFGFVWSVVFLGERSGAGEWGALALCAAGAVALAVDRHAHAHEHRALRHTHPHRHDDGHHDHAHDPGFDPTLEHVHEHLHQAVRHSHPHVHDEHHRHRH
jgi:drug/metabolite transporter (DMT)-like permease